MISRNQIKSTTALHVKKFRNEEKLFIAEGEKVVNDLLVSDWSVKSIFGTQMFFQNLDKAIRIDKETEVVLVTEDELKKISALSAPQNVLAVVEIPEKENDINYEGGLKLVLDGISDPGNLGTLIRIADWFGIGEIVCSENTVDCFNPKVVQSAMGSLFRVKLFYMDPAAVFRINLSKNKLPVYGTVLNGKDLHEATVSTDSFIVVGNESAGISGELMKYITTGITIPSSPGRKIDSLNVAVATGIVCARFRRS